MIRLSNIINCPACKSQYEPRDGYVCTLAEYDHFRCPDCGEMTSRSIESDRSDALENG